MAVPLSVSAPSEYPLELWGVDPSTRASMPKVFILNNDVVYDYGWNEWSFVGILRKTLGRKHPSSFMAEFVRRSSICHAIEPKLDTDKIFTEAEVRRHFVNPFTAVQGLNPKGTMIEKTLSEVAYFGGQHYLDLYTDLPQGQAAKRDKNNHPFWEFFDHTTQEAQDFLSRHFVNINGKNYIKSLDFDPSQLNIEHVPESKAIKPKR